jgi:hypothetical protein
MSCSLGQRSACTEAVIISKGFEAGQKGALNQSSYLLSRCSQKKDFKKKSTLYEANYKKGLSQFCSRQRGIEQAQYGLKKEAVCTNFKKYSEGHQYFLKTNCTVQKAKKDAKSLRVISNIECLKIPSYKKAYFLKLQKNCNYKKGAELGYLKKSTEDVCHGIKNRTTFLRGYKNGLKNHYRNNNLKITKKIKSLNKKRAQLKIKLASLKKSEDIKSLQEVRTRLNVVESNLLNLKHEFEKNLKRL